MKVNSSKIISAIFIFTIPTIVNIVLEIIDEKTEYESCWINANSNDIEKYQLAWDDYQAELERQEEQERLENIGNGDVFSKNISFSCEIVNDGTYMPYALYTPSTNSRGDIPLIVWLHGYGDGSTNQEKIETRGLPRAIAEWDFENFNAYVVAPQITGKWRTSWYKPTAKKYVDAVVGYFIDNYNVDTNKIIIAGHSDGGMGALYMAANDNNNYYAAVVSVSGGNPGGLSNIKVPGQGYAGEYDFKSNYRFTMNTLGNLFGSENVFKIPATGHGEASWETFKLDGDENNRSDAIEWMLEQSKE